jgi:hypothetical protein
MPARTTTRNPAILSYHVLRRLVGIFALSLPFVLPAGAILLALAGPAHALPRPLVERAISDYYYTPMSSVYAGSLWVIAMFLICSRGYDRHDEIAGYLAGAFTLGVALFPAEKPRSAHYTRLQINIGFAHTAFAGLMFLSIAYFCLFLFRRSSPERKLTRRKRHRNAIYAVCGVVIIACMCAMVILTMKGLVEAPGSRHAFFCCESLALIAFGVAWLTKGEGILRDPPHERNHTLTDTAMLH